jgi:bacteriocin biosynthesis cyclodehydratase domain-containing protein
MASAIRLTHVPPASVAIASTGPFGARVGEILTAGLDGGRQLSVSEIATAFTAVPSAVVLALWRPDHGVCETADELSFQTGVRWLPVIMEHPVIRVGPMVCPPAGPCFGCYTRRRAQHDGQPWATTALRAAYDSDVSCGPGGYLPHQARMAAAVAYALLSRPAVDTEGTGAGEVTTIRLLAGGLGTSRVVACHGCTRCGSDAPTGSPDLARELSRRVHTAAGAADVDHGNRKLAVR